jgi:protein-disulfide isomerase
MAVRKVASKRVVKKTVADDMSFDDSVVSMVEAPTVKKTLVEKMAPVLVFAVVVMAFMMGAMWSKIKYMEQGGTGVAAANSKYKNLKAAFNAYAKELKLDTKKFSACFTGGGKNGLVSADAQEGSSLGVQGTPGFFINGRFLPGAFPFTAFKEVIDLELQGKGSNKLTSYSDSLQQSGFIAEPKAVSVGNAPVKGPDNAVVTVVEYSDFQCPFCSRAKPTVEQVLKEYDGKVRVAYKHLPLVQLHPNAEKAAEAAECARDQGKFWEMHDALFDKQAEWSSLPQS